MDEERNVNAAPEQELTEAELNELVRIRMDKLKSLQDAGKNPFELMRYDQQYYSEDVINNYKTVGVAVLNQ